MLNEHSKGQPGLLSSWDNLVGWQGETIAASITKLKGVRVLDALVVGPVNGTSTSLVCEAKIFSG